MNNNNNTDNKKDMDEQYHRVCICDCNSGRFVTSLTKNQIEYIYDMIVKSNIKNGDFISDPIAQGAIETVTEIKEYMNLDKKHSL